MDKVLIYDKFSVNFDNSVIYYYKYNEKQYTITLKVNLPLTDFSNCKIINNCLFNIGMCLLSNIYGAFLPEKILVKCGYLSKKQINFWQKIYFNPEFFYYNQINKYSYANIECNKDENQYDFSEITLENSLLIPFGFGKESIVLHNNCLQFGYPIDWIYLEDLNDNFSTLENSHEIKTKLNPRYITVFEYELDENIELDKEYGFYIDITYTSYYIMLSSLAALIYGNKYIIIGNESSSNEGNFEYNEIEINHQYEKSFDFETMIHSYIKEFIHPEIYFFSGLMSLNELQIMKKFSDLKFFHPHFVSCNIYKKEGNRGYNCGKCEKCLALMILLGAFLPSQELNSIFPDFEKLLSDNIYLFDDFIKHKHKPLECVLTYNELIVAIHLFIQNHSNIKCFDNYLSYLENAEEMLSLLHEKNEDTLYPDWYKI